MPQPRAAEAHLELHRQQQSAHPRLQAAIARRGERVGLASIADVGSSHARMIIVAWLSAATVVLMLGHGPPVIATSDDEEPPPACQARMDAYCNNYRSASGLGCSPPFDGGGRSVCPKHAKYVARRDRGSNLTNQWGQIAWRCYSDAMLSPDHSHYVNGTCYCTQSTQLAWLLCNCTQGKDCGSAPHPEGPSPCLAPAPPPPQELSFVDVFALNSTLNTCYRIPLITYTASGTLLAISEERYDAVRCPDNYPAGQPGGHNQVSRRSTDMGKTWGPIIRQVGSLENLKAVGGVDYTNPSVPPLA